MIPENTDLPPRTRIYPREQRFTPENIIKIYPREHEKIEIYPRERSHVLGGNLRTLHPWSLAITEPENMEISSGKDLILNTFFDGLGNILIIVQIIMNLLQLIFMEIS